MCVNRKSFCLLLLYFWAKLRGKFLLVVAVIVLLWIVVVKIGDYLGVIFCGGCVSTVSVVVTGGASVVDKRCLLWASRFQ